MALLKTSDLALHLNNANIFNGLPDIIIEKGQHVVILGQSGSGKTTIMNVMAGIKRPDSGEIYYEDKPYSKMGDPALDKLRGKNFGFIFQKLHLLNHLNVSQNIALAFSGAKQKVNRTRIEELLENLNLKHKKHQKTASLSHGEAQRTAIARALAHNPKIVFADEPTSALDDANTKTVMNQLLEQAQLSDATLIVCTHDARIKDHFDTVLEMTS